MNGAPIIMEVAPYVRDGRMMVPLRYVAEAFAADADLIRWNSEERSASLSKGVLSATFTAGSTRLIVRNMTVTMDVAPELVNGRLMLPVRWVALALNGQAFWDGSTQEAVVTSPW